MAIGKVKKQRVAAAPREPRADAPGKRTCVTCGAERKKVEFQFEMVSLLDPAEYACNTVCYQPWQKAQTKAMPPKL